MRRVIGIDIHRTFGEVVIRENGVPRHVGRVEMTRTALEGFARTLEPTDEVAAHLVPKCPHADLFNQRGRAWLARQVVPEDERAAIERDIRELDRLTGDRRPGPLRRRRGRFTPSSCAFGQSGAIRSRPSRWPAS